MPGQPAWTLTELLECNLPLCWAGGGDCNVGPAQCLFGSPFSLKPIRAICFMIKHMSSRGRFILEQKTGVCWCVFPGAKRSSSLCRYQFLQQPVFF